MLRAVCPVLFYLQNYSHGQQDAPRAALRREGFLWIKKLLHPNLGRYMFSIADYKASDFKGWVLIS